MTNVIQTGTLSERRGFFIMMDETTNSSALIPDLTDMEEVRKAIIANEILTRKY